MTDATEMPKYDGMEYEELVAAAQFLWMQNAKLRELVAHYDIAVKAEDAEPSEALAWSNRCDELRRELGIEVSGD